MTHAPEDAPQRSFGCLVIMLVSLVVLVLMFALVWKFAWSPPDEDTIERFSGVPAFVSFPA